MSVKGAKPLPELAPGTQTGKLLEIEVVVSEHVILV
jgi:hypothetical protein